MGEQLKQGQNEEFDAFMARGGAPDVWHIADTPDGVVIHQIVGVRNGAEGDEALEDTHGLIAEQIRQELGFPEGWNTADGWNSALSYGEPHPKTMNKAYAIRRWDVAQEPGVTGGQPEQNQADTPATNSASSTTRIA